MSRTRRVFGKDFKAKVVLEALKEKETLEVLAKKYDLLPTQISAWKAEQLRIFQAFLIKKKRFLRRKKFLSRNCLQELVNLL